MSEWLLACAAIVYLNERVGPGGSLVFVLISAVVTAIEAALRSA